MDKEPALRYSKAPDYPEVAKEALAEMVRQTGEAVFDEYGMLKKGVIARHLLLPEQLSNAKAVVEYIYDTYGDKVFLSLMNQYTPLPQVEKYPEINRKVTEEEYDELIDYAIDLGVENGFIQEGETAEESFIPEFDGEGV
jgi:putative pyruvate formate lyase activating enzyme